MERTMHPAENIITVHLTEAPSGMFRELSPCLGDRMQTIEAGFASAELPEAVA